MIVGRMSFAPLTKRTFVRCVTPPENLSQRFLWRFVGVGEQRVSNTCQIRVGISCVLSWSLQSLEPDGGLPGRTIDACAFGSTVRLRRSLESVGLATA